MYPTCQGLFSMFLCFPNTSPFFLLPGLFATRFVWKTLTMAGLKKLVKKVNLLMTKVNWRKSHLYACPLTIIYCFNKKKSKEIT